MGTITLPRKPYWLVVLILFLWCYGDKPVEGAIYWHQAAYDPQNSLMLIKKIVYDHLLEQQGRQFLKRDRSPSLRLRFGRRSPANDDLITEQNMENVYGAY